MALRIAAQTGTAFELKRGNTLTVFDSEGQQVSDLFCFSSEDRNDALSSGRSIDYNETVLLTTGHKLYSNSGQVMMTIVFDSCGTHDFLVTPCSRQMFRMMSGDETLEHPSCQANLISNLEKFGIDPAKVTTTFNIFMNVPVSPTGQIRVLTPKSKRGDSVVFRAEMDLIVGLTACSDPGSNGGRCKPIEYELR